jgi:cytochrome P450
VGEDAVREPHVLRHDESPFAFDISEEERRARRLAQTADVVTDDDGQMILFSADEDVEALLNDPRFGAVAMPVLEMCGVTSGPLHDLWSLLMFGKDGADHKRLRSTVARNFTPRAVEHYRDDIRQFASELADETSVSDGVVELWSAFSLPLAGRSACRVVGIDIADSAMVAQWALDLVSAFFFMSPERAARAEQAAVAFLSYLDGLLDAKREQPGDDVTSQLVAADATHDLSRDEVRALVANLVFGGLEATAKALTTGVFHLLEQDRWRNLADRPEIAPHAVAELLRFAPPTGVARFAREDLVCRDVQVAAGQLALLDLEGACRDPRRYAQPDVLDLSRESGRQLAFGAGVHFCLGANLAKVVLECGYAELATRFPKLQLAGTADDVGWDFETFDGVVRLPLVLAP